MIDLKPVNLPDIELCSNPAQRPAFKTNQRALKQQKHPAAQTFQ